MSFHCDECSEQFKPKRVIDDFECDPCGGCDCLACRDEMKRLRELVASLIERLKERDKK